MLRKAGYKSLKTASSDGNRERFFDTLRSVMLGDSIVFVV